jgi:hypothetical protein
VLPLHLVETLPPAVAEAIEIPPEVVVPPPEIYVPPVRIPKADRN